MAFGVFPIHPHIYEPTFEIDFATGEAKRIIDGELLEKTFSAATQNTDPTLRSDAYGPAAGNTITEMKNDWGFQFHNMVNREASWAYVCDVDVGDAAPASAVSGGISGGITMQNLETSFTVAIAANGRYTLEQSIKVDETVNGTLHDSYFTPTPIEIAPNQTVRYVVRFNESGDSFFAWFVVKLFGQAVTANVDTTSIGDGAYDVAFPAAYWEEATQAKLQGYNTLGNPQKTWIGREGGIPLKTVKRRPHGKPKGSRSSRPARAPQVDFRSPKSPISTSGDIKVTRKKR